MNISVIISTLNEENYIEQLLHALQNQSFKASEIHVIDGGSQDKTMQIVTSFADVMFSHADKPVGNQRDKGGEIARGDMLIFLDADTLPDKTFIASVISEMLKRKLSIACPHYVPYPGSAGSNAFYSFFNRLFSFSQYYYPSGAGSCICVSKEVFKKAGGFNKHLRFDDIAFIRKACKYGKFGFLNAKINVSDRRIRKYGLFQTILTYSILSLLFCFGAYRMANYVPYTFGKFTSRKNQ